jgi:hypothetical protein
MAARTLLCSCGGIGVGGRAAGWCRGGVGWRGSSLFCSFRRRCAGQSRCSAQPMAALKGGVNCLDLGAAMEHSQRLISDKVQTDRTLQSKPVAAPARPAGPSLEGLVSDCHNRHGHRSQLACFNCCPVQLPFSLLSVTNETKNCPKQPTLSLTR